MPAMGMWALFIYNKHMEIKVKINGKEYLVKYSVRSEIIWESIMKKRFSIESLKDLYLFYYCIILACNPDNPPTLDEYFDALDADRPLVKTLGEFVEREWSLDAFLGGDNEGDSKTDDSKKNKRH